MSFKLKPPIDIDPVARYEVPFQPDNFEDKTGLIARANDNGNMIVNKNIPKDSKLRKVAESHEDHHLRDIMDGKLAYDSKAVYHNMDGKGMKKTSRSEFDESDKNLPWEAPAYRAGENMEQKDMRPKKEKLNRAQQIGSKNFAFAFREIGKPMRKQDSDTVSMSENFGSAMIKSFGTAFKSGEGEEGGPEGKKIKIEETGGSDASGNPVNKKAELEAKAKANAEAELAKKNYEQEVMPDGRIRFSKSAEGSASGEDNIVPGSKAKVVPGSKLTTDPGKYVEDLIKDGKTREEVIEGSLVRKELYDLFPSSKETATASDVYYENPKKKTPPPEKSPPPPKEDCPDGYGFSISRGCVKMPSQKRRKTKGKSKQKLLSTKKSTECVFGEKC